MSQALKIAVTSRLTGDTALVALLGKDPNSPADPAIFNATKSQAPPVYDCLTFRIDTGSLDKRFRPPPGLGPSTVEDVYYECEAWTQAPDSAPLEAIGVRLRALFENAAFPFTGGRVFESTEVVYQTDLYDDKLNSWYGLFRYRLRTQATP